MLDSYQIKGDATMKRLLSLLLVFAMVLSLSSCAKTPDAPVVMQKDQEQLVEKANSLEDTSETIVNQTAVPKHISDHFANDNGILDVTVGADVLLPERENAQIIRVSERELTQADVDLWTEVFFGNETLYQPESLNVVTKSELQRQLIEDKKMLAEMEAKGGGEIIGTTNETDENGVTVEKTLTEADEWREMVEYLEKRIEEAPAERTPIETTNQLKTVEKELVHAGQTIKTFKFPAVWVAAESQTHEGMKSLSARAQHGTQRLCYQDAGMRPESDILEPFYLSYDYIRDYHDLHPEQEFDDYEALERLPEPTLSETDAKAQADELVQKLGLSEMALSQCEKKLAVDRTSGVYWKGWRLEYRRVLDGISVTHTGCTSSYPEENQIWEYERFSVFLDDSGVLEAAWYAPYQIQDALSENCKLLEYDKISDIFRQMMQIEYQPGPTPEGDGETISDVFQITDVEFGYTRIAEQNADGLSGLMIPTWSFFGDREWTVKSAADGELWSGKEYRSDRLPVLTINAIDGSVIDIEKGY